VQKYKLDIANALNVASIRIQNQLFVYKGQSYLAIEAPKKRTADLFWDAKYLVDKKLPLGLDNFQQPVVWDLNNHSTPHMLVCGATGSGKSVSIISTLEYAIKADVKDIVIFDPKFEFTHYTKNSNIEVYNEIDDIETMMELMVEEMNNRIKSGTTTKKLVIFDEFADALSQSKKGKELDIYEEVQDGFYRMSEKAMLAGVKPQPKMKRKKVGRKNSLEENLMRL
jgi:DNA segregation ATPase FtsK/SpoIIIE-like protein